MSVKMRSLPYFFLIASCAPANVTPENEALTKSTTHQSTWASKCEKWDEWDKAGPPFKVHGNSYYVGTCGISSILITSDKGHILIDSGTETGADTVLANIRKLGIDPMDIKILLHSHEHYDHVGGFAKLQKLINARLISSVKAKPVFQSGYNASDDPQAGLHSPMKGVEVDTTISNDEKITLGSLTLTAMETPGHTPGALSWRWPSCEKQDCVSIVYADSLSPVSSDSYRFGDHPTYLYAYRNGLKQLASIPCDILLTPHPSASDMKKRIESAKGLRNSTACMEYAENITAKLNKRLTDEKKESANGAL